MSWYDTGYNGIAKEEERIASMQTPYRLWIPAGKSNEIALIDDEPVCIYEHQWKINGNWRNWYTCLQGVEENVVCCREGGEKSRAYVGYYTMVQCTPSEDKKGKKYQYEVQLLGAKLKILKKLNRKKAEKGTIAMCRYKVTREDDKSPSCGDEFEFIGEVTNPAKLFEVANYRGKMLSELWDKAEEKPEQMARLAKVFKLEFENAERTKLVRKVVAFNYPEVLKPRSAEELSRMFKSSSIEQGEAGKGKGGGGTGDDDIPF